MTSKFDGSILIETDLGHLVVDLATLQAPRAVANFTRLCEIGYYRNTLIYNIEPDFVAFAGDHTGTGIGGTSFDELNKQVGQEQLNIGTIPSVESMEEEEEATDSLWEGNLLCSLPLETVPRSQFLLTLNDAKTPRYSHLKGKHTIIGRIVEDSSNALQAISRTYIDEKGRPLRDVRIRRTIVLVYPPSIQPLTESQKTAYAKLVPEPDIDVPKTEWDAIVERPSLFMEIQQDEDEETAELRKQKLLAESRAIELEILGDLTSADAKPQENVLFVCKLNPITKSEDLKIIFSRFGEVVDSDVKRDPETQESLQYAFVSFATKEQCEEAYKKMQNVVIDGRRVIVDFSQSEGKRMNQVARFQSQKSNLNQQQMRPREITNQIPPKRSEQQQQPRRRRSRSPPRRRQPEKREDRMSRTRSRLSSFSSSSSSSSSSSEEDHRHRKKSRRRQEESDEEEHRHSKKKHKRSKKSHKSRKSSSRRRSRSRSRERK